MEINKTEDTKTKIKTIKYKVMREGRNKLK